MHPMTLSREEKEEEEEEGGSTQVGVLMCARAYKCVCAPASGLHTGAARSSRYSPPPRPACFPRAPCW